MTKLEELTALLVNEINDFNKGVEKLEKISEQLNDNQNQNGCIRIQIHY